MATGLLVLNAAFWACYRICVSRAATAKPARLTDLPPVSVIIVYKNAGSSISELVSSLLTQDYPEFEILAVNDFSTDEGPGLLAAFRDERLRLLNATLDTPGKKQALQQGIKAARFPYILLTDADCRPASDTWIKSMASSLDSNEKGQIVAGYGPTTQTDTLLNDFARFETITTAMQYISAAILGSPYMGVGRNIMYTRALFDSAGGFDSHSHIISGDDDLFVRDAADIAVTHICMEKGSFMYSPSKDTLEGYLSQKSRHISTSLHYKWIHKVLLGVLPACHVGFYAIILAVMLAGWMGVLPVTVLLAGRWVTMTALLRKPVKLLAGKDLVAKLPLLDMLYALYYCILPVYSLFRKRSW